MSLVISEFDKNLHSLAGATFLPKNHKKRNSVRLPFMAVSKTGDDLSTGLGYLNC